MIHPKPKPVREKKQKKRKQKSAKQLLEIKADRIVREIVVLRDGFCVCPPPAKGHSEVLQPGHLITRAKKSVRWDLRNTNCQCLSCNARHEYYSHYYTNWYVSEFGSESYSELCKQSEKTIKCNEQYLSVICYGLEFILFQLKSHIENGLEYIPRFSQEEIYVIGDFSWKNSDNVVTVKNLSPKTNSQKTGQEKTALKSSVESVLMKDVWNIEISQETRKKDFYMENNIGNNIN